METSKLHPPEIKRNNWAPEANRGASRPIRHGGSAGHAVSTEQGKSVVLGIDISNITACEGRRDNRGTQITIKAKQEDYILGPQLFQDKRDHWARNSRLCEAKQHRLDANHSPVCRAEQDDWTRKPRPANVE